MAKIIISFLIIIGLFNFYIRPAEAGFFSWFSKVTKVFTKDEPPSENELEPASTEQPEQEIPETTAMSSAFMSTVALEKLLSEEKTPEEYRSAIKDLKNQIAGLNEQVKTLEEKLVELKSQKPETIIKEVIKEIPVEKIVIKEIIKETECNLDAPRILSIEVIQNTNSASIKWETDRLTKSKAFISGGNLTEKKEFPSVFSTATAHRVNISGLWPDTSYHYEIHAITMKNGKELGTAKKEGEFYTSPELPEE